MEVDDANGCLWREGEEEREEVGGRERRERKKEGGKKVKIENDE